MRSGDVAKALLSRIEKLAEDDVRWKNEELAQAHASAINQLAEAFNRLIR